MVIPKIQNAIHNASSPLANPTQCSAPVYFANSFQIPVLHFPVYTSLFLIFPKLSAQILLDITNNLCPIYLDLFSKPEITSHSPTVFNHNFILPLYACINILKKKYKYTNCAILKYKYKCFLFSLIIKSLFLNISKIHGMNRIKYLP